MQKLWVNEQSTQYIIVSESEIKNFTRSKYTYVVKYNIIPKIPKI